MAPRSPLIPRPADDKDLPHPQMNIHLSLTPLLALIAGVLILIMPKLLNFIVAVYLILVGLIGLLGMGALHLH